MVVSLQTNLNDKVKKYLTNILLLKVSDFVCGFDQFE